MPSGFEATQFTWKPATEYDEQWVAIDVPAARTHLRRFLHAAANLPLAEFLP